MHPRDLTLAIATEVTAVRNCWHAAWPWVRGLWLVWQARGATGTDAATAADMTSAAGQTIDRLLRNAPLAAEWIRKCADGARLAGVAKNFRSCAVLIGDLLEELNEARNAMGREAKLMTALKQETADAVTARGKAEAERDLANAAAKDLQVQLDGARKQLSDQAAVGAVKDDEDLRAEAAELARLNLDGDGNPKPAPTAGDASPAVAGADKQPA